MAYFEHRSPAFWVPQRKPGPRHRIQFNPNGTFSQGLLSLLMFDRPVLNASGIEDRVVPHRVFTYTGTTQILLPVQFGGTGFQTGGNSNDQLNYSTALPSLNEWTVSTLCSFDGAASGTYAGNLVIAANTGVTNYIGAGGTGSFTSAIGTWSGQIDMATLKGPHRVTITSSVAATATILYTDGKQNGTTIANSMATAFGLLFSGWPWTASDLFIWNRALTPTEVADHAANPYTVLRPRGDIRLARRPSGLPPQRIQIWDH